MGLFKRSSKKPDASQLPPPPPYNPGDHEAAQSPALPPLPEIPKPPVFAEPPKAPPLPEEPKAPEPTEVPPQPPKQDLLHIPPIKLNKKPRQVRTVDEDEEVYVDPTLHRPKILGMDNVQPLFVSVSDYQTILDGVDRIKEDLGQTEAHVAQILRHKQDAERVIDEWRNQLEDIQKKLSYVDEVLFETQ